MMKFVKMELITKGFSEDKKYCVTTSDGTKYLLRITPISRYETRKSLFDMLKQIAALDIPMCKPVEFGTCDEGVYSLQTWIEGEDLEKLIPSLSETTQYTLGLKAGEILKILHSIQAPENSEDWSSKYIEGAYNQLEEFNKTGVKIEGSNTIFRYFENNKHLINNRPLCFNHGDYHTGNFMITPNGDLYVVDWDMYSFGDPWNEFSAINNADVFPHFATGLIRGYFGGSSSHGMEPPVEFWSVIALYLSVRALSNICWAVYVSPASLGSCVQNVTDTLCWHDNMQNPVPTWYLKEIKL